LAFSGAAAAGDNSTAGCTGACLVVVATTGFFAFFEVAIRYFSFGGWLLSM
jgi:hypothetical protein